MDSTTRKIFIGGNWKCNGDRKFIKDNSLFLKSIKFDNSKCDVVICPAFIHLESTLNELSGSSILVSAQNVSMNDNGAFTGEISAKQLKDLNIKWTLVGHSERRQFFGDTEEVISKKIKISLQNGINVIACIGEKLEERNEGKTLEVCISQMKTIVESVENNWDKIVIAYEPVWAIGTGKTATPEMAQEVHQQLRKWIIENINEKIASNIRIIYGGSVTEGNCNSLIKEKDIDGFLVGGASLKSDFSKIILSYEQKF
jgi:triosephosphate isomerase